MPVTPAPTEDPGAILSLQARLREIAAAVRAQGEARLAGWAAQDLAPEFAPSAANLAHYLALRHHDLRDLQDSLMVLGLSSLGRLESRVLPTLAAVDASLNALAGLAPGKYPGAEAFFAGQTLLRRRTEASLGAPAPGRDTTFLVTCPSEAADDPAFMLEAARHGVEAVRINCAHDDAGAWGRMVGHARHAEEQTGHRLKILMDLAGPKIRTGAVRLPEGRERIGRGDRLAVLRAGGIALRPPAGVEHAVECSLDEPLDKAKAGQPLFIDDGKLRARIETVEDWGLLARIDLAPDKGVRLKPEKGLNFPETELAVPALTAKDLADLDFVAARADGIGLSFVQTAADVEMLQAALAERRPHDWRKLSLILKIERPQAVRDLPEIVVRAAGRQPTAIMIARGDLAVEIGFARLAEMQEEILWIGEAAHLPVIWATQVLERLIRKGVPSRGEMTDAAMAARAECVMLNKGPYIWEAVAQLDTLLRRMGEHQHKKTPRLRALASW